jgi:putative PIN family toxin of toxin-antitoxin system
VRVVLDPNVIISALLSPDGSPARVFRSWIDGAYDLVVSERLLGELERALGYPKLRKRVTPEEAGELLRLLRLEADLRIDPAEAPPVRSPDPDDDYLIALAVASQAVIVSGDDHLLGIADGSPVFSPAAFLGVIEGVAQSG